MQHLYADLGAKFAKGDSQIGLADVQVFRTFRWMLSKQESDNVDQWIKSILKDLDPRTKAIEDVAGGKVGDGSTSGAGGGVLAATGFVGTSVSSDASAPATITVDVESDKSKKLQKASASSAGVANIMKFFGGVAK